MQFDSDEELIAWWEGATPLLRGLFTGAAVNGDVWARDTEGFHFPFPSDTDFSGGDVWTVCEPPFHAGPSAIGLRHARYALLAISLDEADKAEAKTIEKVGEDAYELALRRVFVRNIGNYEPLEIIRADASTRCLACLLALRGQDERP